MERPEALKGGRASKYSPWDFDKKQLSMGIEIELEHTRDAYIAMLIAMDHLAEYPDYYTHLIKMEDRLKRKWS